MSHLMITKTLWWILVYSLLIYATITRWPAWDFYPIKITPPQAAQNIIVFLLLGVALWIVYDIVRYVIKIATIPVNRFTLWLLHVLINIGILYLLPFVFTYLYPSVTLEMGVLVEVALFSLWLGFIRGFIK